MAAPSDKTYFPPLEDCLKGKSTLLSWRLVASALEDSNNDRLTSTAVSEFLRDSHVHQLLKEPSKPFGPPTNQSKLEFETKTGAINVVPSPNDPYDLKVIKEDAKWLSKNANVNEMAALRIVVVEYQSRAHSHLTGPLSTQDVANIQEAAGLSDAQVSSFLSAHDVVAVVDAESNWAEFESETRRRQRLITTYLAERRSFLGSADAFTTFLLHSRPGSRTPATDELRQDIMKAAFNWDDRAFEVADPTLLKAMAPSYFAILGKLVEETEKGPDGVEEAVLTPQIDLDWRRTFVTEVIHAMSVAFQIMDLEGPQFHSPDLVAQWFGFLDVYRFLEPIIPILEQHDMLVELILPVQSLMTVISLKLLNIDRSLLYLSPPEDLDRTDVLADGEEPYLASAELLSKIHSILQAATTMGVSAATPLVFAWSLIIHSMHVGYQDRAERRDLINNQRARGTFESESLAPPTPPEGRQRRNSGGSLISIEQSPYDAFLEAENLERDMQVAESMAMVATSRGHVYDVISKMISCLGNGETAAFRSMIGARARLVFEDLLKRTFHVVGYQVEPLSCLLSLLSGNKQYWDISPEAPNSAALDMYTQMLTDPILKTQYTEQSHNRYPYEFIPFTALCRYLLAALVSDKESSEQIVGWLYKTPSLTIEWNPMWDRSYHLVFEDENTNSFCLDEDIDLFAARSARKITAQEKFTIPSGTYGRFVTDVGRVAKLEFEHSTLALLGKRLEVNLSAGMWDSALEPLSMEDVAEAIALLATVLRTEVLRSTGKSSKPNTGSAIKVLQETSSCLPRNNDIIRVVCGILNGLVEEEPTELDASKLKVMTACLQFLHALLPVVPGRVWSYMSSCSLINNEGRSGRLSRITGNLEIYAERAEFLQSAVRLFSSLVESAMANAAQRRTATSPNARVRVDQNPWAGMSEKILSQVCLSIAQTAVDVFENSATWRFESEVGRGIVITEVVNIMTNLLFYTFSMGSPESPKNLTGCLLDASRYIIEGFLAPASSSLRFQPLLTSLLDAFKIDDSTLFPCRSRIVSERLTGVVSFSTIILRVASFLDHPTAAIQTQLFKSAALIARLPAIKHSFKTPAIALLSALVENAGKGTGEPPSLLGYLGPQISHSFIQIASQLDKPFDRIPEVVSTWNFFSIILRNRQQWMANCLLTGKTPRQALKGDSKMAEISPDSVLSTALEKLRSIASLPSQETLAVLDFFTSAQNYWAWTIFAMQKDKSFLESLRSYVKNLKAPELVFKNDPAEAGYQARIAAYIAETFAMQLYHLRQMRQEQDFATKVVEDLDYFLRHGVQVADYNASLHSNFAKNFSQRYAGLELDDFKRTVLVPKNLGAQYYYALDFADKMLGYDAGWAGAGTRQNGFRAEMKKANLNLSLVEAEVYLILELSSCLLPKSGIIARQMVQVAEQCLEANQRPSAPDHIFVRLAESRANLTLTLLKRLADCSQLPKDFTQLLTLITAAINGVDNPWGPENITYFRTLLRILFVTLRGTRLSSNAPAPQKSGHETSVAATQLVLTILDRVVAHSFRTLSGLVHEPGSPTEPDDMTLITGVLQACLAVPGLDQCQVQILNIMSSYNIFQVATSLFSWSDKLVGPNGDPIYGEISLLFLLELSSLPQIAEQLACDGILGHITSANIAGFLRRKNITPFTESASKMRCYSIWSRALLPLLINILGALGSTIAPEVAFVLNQFPNLLESSIERLAAPGMDRTTIIPTMSFGGSEDRSHPFYITLATMNEIHSLSLLAKVLGALRENNTRDIPEVTGWDGGRVLENVEFWLQSRKVLRERLLPMTEKEREWWGMKAQGGGDSQTVLEEKVVGMLEGVRDVLMAGEGEE
ncbi:nucleoporin subcomplex protein binding to Pom34-domain-containing protein [Apiosordaria backusii]|uniref:Nucleoporin NUP188 n=1 Tax=Apiosordaria backusii TaxID=314023 RepID=A0AA40F0Q7_9PEZI|nr:nucleoporin subcomplex protein binding to Pom34-domain-containing protein [Apiosordaria backusii]